MRRNFTPDETLIDQLVLNDTVAFEEIHRRYCYSLYSYCFRKLGSAEDARNIVRDMFIALWVKRHSLPVGFSISLHFYTAVRRAVVNSLNEKLYTDPDQLLIKQKVFPGFAIARLLEARQPVKPLSLHKQTGPGKKNIPEQPWWNQYPAPVKMKRMKVALQKAFQMY